MTASVINYKVFKANNLFKVWVWGWNLISNKPGIIYWIQNFAAWVCCFVCQIQSIWLCISESLCIFSMGNIHLSTTGKIFDLSSEPYCTKLCVIISSGSFPFCFIFVMIFKCCLYSWQLLLFGPVFWVKIIKCFLLF